MLDKLCCSSVLNQIERDGNVSPGIREGYRRCLESLAVGSALSLAVVRPARMQAPHGRLTGPPWGTGHRFLRGLNASRCRDKP